MHSLGAAALVLISFAAGSWRSCLLLSGERCENDNGAACQPEINFHPNGHSTNISAGVAPHDARHRPFYDLVVAVLAVGGDSPGAQEEIARVRKVYARYGNEVVPGGPTSTAPPFTLTFRVVFVVGRAGLPEDVELPAAGLLLGDFYHVDVREGYTHLSDKTRAMAGLVEHLRYVSSCMHLLITATVAPVVETLCVKPVHGSTQSVPSYRIHTRQDGTCAV